MARPLDVKYQVQIMAMFNDDVNESDNCVENWNQMNVDIQSVQDHNNLDVDQFIV